MPGWEQTELVQPCLKWAILNQLIEGKKDISMETLKTLCTGAEPRPGPSAFRGPFWIRHQWYQSLLFLLLQSFLVFAVVGKMAVVITTNRVVVSFEWEDGR